MSKTTISIIVITIVVLAGGAGTGYLLLKPTSPSKTPYPTPKALETTGVEQNKKLDSKDLTYDDSSGFSFMYPETITVSDTTPSEASYYTQISLTQGAEKLLISVRDTKSKTIADWLKTKEAPASAVLSGELTMGGMTAEQYEADGKFYTIAIDSGVIYVLESPKSNDWEAVHNKIAGSFAFAGSSSATSASAGSSASDTIYEEEIVE